MTATYWTMDSDFLPDQVTSEGVTGDFTTTGVGTVTMLVEASIHPMALAPCAKFVLDQMRLATTSCQGRGRQRTPLRGTYFFLGVASARCVFLLLALCCGRWGVESNDLALTSTPSA